ncbi:RraA family protein [Phytomonospora endophytica]|uniref:Putative 4-hydroxy-4-methyl-2-oxoglutarate aldolase n=1 Tax=Phytomonospora endophytica TaxID=714109 RepID=A0A841FPB8_9ACTN|nr:RraA family protein [Phytomonospora endophytica]MBB6035087.1 regulator of RNase E activity RraA [Phytomonospora endophytica]GIG64164.1 demethylmenaquinone methyltransferase [Phytomonospora endophytica]
MSLTPEIAARLAELDTTAVTDADKSVRVLSPRTALRSANGAMLGTAFTVRCEGDHFGIVRALEQAAAGDVLVIEGGRHPLAYAGEIFAKAAMAKGLAGIVLDGGYRDLAYVKDCPLPIYSTYVYPKTGTTRLLGEIGATVTVGGVAVSPGEILLADDNGVLVLEPDTLDGIIARAEQIHAAEAKVLAKIEAGAGIGEVINSAEHAARLTAGEETALRFTV